MTPVLANTPQWVLVLLAPIAAKPGKTDKIPCDHASGQPGVNAHDSRYWTTYDQARAVADSFGPAFTVGFVLTERDDFFCLDIDGARLPNGQWSPLATALVSRLPGCMVEVSQSGNGLHVWGRYPSPPPHRKKRTDLGIELYTEARFIAVGTGQTGEIAERCDALPALIDALFAPTEASGELPEEGPRADWLGPTDDAELLRRALQSKSAGSTFGGKASFADLYHAVPEVLARCYPGDGEHGYDASSADAALFQHLAFWTGCDHARMLRLADGSALKRDKWEREDYLRRTVAHARSLQKEVLRDKPVEAIREAQRKRAQAIGDGEETVPPLAEVLTLESMLADLVLISDGSRIARRQHPHLSLPASEYKVLTKASRVEVGGRTFAAADLWLQHPQRITVHTLTFRPGHPEFTTDPEGAQALNLWRPRRRALSTADVTPFLEHVAYLVPIEAERARFLSWLAHIEQFPGVLPHTHYLMVTPQTGIGRNWLASVLARVWAGATRLGFDLAESMRTGFNGPLSRRLLVIVDELKAADNGYGAGQHAQALKAMLTTEHRGINPKYGRQHIEFNCVRWLMLSQHHDALPLEHSDRRVIVIDNPTARRPVEYYRNLYALLEDIDFINAIGEWLAQRDIEDFNPSEPAPLSSAKQTAIDASMSEAARALVSLRQDADTDVMPAFEIHAYLKQCGISVPAGRAVTAVYRDAGFASCTHLVSIGGRKTRVVALRRTEELRSAPAATLAALLPDPAKAIHPPWNKITR